LFVLKVEILFFTIKKHKIMTCILKKTLILFFSFFAMIGYGQVNQFEWIVEAGKTIQLGIEVADSRLIETDTAGNIYMIVSAWSTSLTIGDTTFSVTNPDGRMYLAKIDKTGHTNWVYESTGNGNGITIDQKGDCYVVGQVNSNNENFHGTTIAGPTNSSAFVIKVRPDGTLDWGKLLAGAAPFNGELMSVKLNKTALRIGGSTGNFYTKIDTATGNVQHQTNSITPLAGFRISTDAIGNNYFLDMSGSWQSFSIGGVSFTPPVPSGSSVGMQSIIVKQDSIGNTDWIRLFDYEDFALFDIEADNSGNLFVLGQVYDSLQLSPSTTIYSNQVRQYFIAKYDVNFNLVWHKKVGGYAAGAFPLGTYEPKLALDPIGNVYVAALFYGNHWIDNYQIAVPNNSYTSAVIKMSSKGQLIWIKTLKGTNNGPKGLAVGYNGIYLYGSVIQGSVQAANQTITSTLDEIEFVTKLKETQYNNLVEGVVFYDNNGDGIQNPQDTGLRNALVNFNNDFYKSTDINGNYASNLSSGVYTIGGVILPYWEQTTLDTTINFTGNWLNVPSFKIGMRQMPGVQDLEVNISSTAIRPGFDMSYFVTYRNVGSTIMSGQVELLLDDTLTYLTSTSMGSYNNSVVSWNYSNLVPGESRSERVYCNMPVALGLLGTNMAATANVQPIATDTTPANNTIIYNQSITGSYDPNDKQVTPIGAVDTNFVKDGTFTYLIRFQNTGNDTAFTVRVADTLDTKLDISTFEMIGASHNYGFELTNRAIMWTFNNILLPDSTTNEPASHGFIQYKIRPKSETVLNDTIANTAHIYFDFNPAIVTNTTISAVEIVVSTSKMTAQQVETINVFPNPTDGRITCEIEDFENNEQYLFKVFDMQGKEVHQEELSTARHTIHLNNLPTGMYVFQVTNTKNVLKGIGKILVR
jgi:uncharacterized repeat protein (TIGR01451 family)